jgi:O-antigen ligase
LQLIVASSARLAGLISRKNSLLLPAALVALFGVIGGWASVILSGTKTGVALALAAIFGPISVYYALTAPLLFPFGLYVIAVPFDYIMPVTAFGTLTKVLGLAAGFALLVYLARAGYALKPPPVLFIWAALVVWTAMTAFWAIDVTTVFRMMPTLAQLVILYAVISIYPAGRRDVKFVLGAALVGGLIAAASGAYLFHSGLDTQQGRLFYGASAGAARQTQIDPNHFVAGLLLPAALTLVGTLSANRILPKLAWGGAFLLLMAGETVAASRGGAVALAVMVLFLFVRSRWKLQLAAFISLAGILSLFYEGQLWSRFSTANSAANLQSGSGRLDIWHVGLLALKSHWLLGAGFYNFPYAYNQALLQAHTTFTKWALAPHDVLIGTSVELGLIGLALVLAGWYMQFRMLSIVPPESDDYPLRLAIEAATLGLFVAAIFLDMLATKYLWLTFIAGTLLYNSYKRSTTCAPNSSRTPVPTSRRLRLLASSTRSETGG